MNFRIKVVVSLMAFALTSAVVNAADSYKIDPTHSSVVFKVKHLNTSYIFGRFNKFGGTIAVDNDASKMSFEVSAQTDSVDTGVGKRDTHLKSGDFFSAKEFPVIKFKSTSVKAAGDNKYEVAGEMTLHGQTKPITVTVEKTGASDTPETGKKAGFISTFTVKRSDFGMNFMVGPVSDEIELTVSFEAGVG